MFACMALVLLTARPDLVAPTDGRIAYIGRFDMTNSKGPTCEWSASAARLRVKGKELKVTLQDRDLDYVQVVVDGAPTEVIKVGKEPQTASLALGKNGEHTVELVKRTEAWIGALSFSGFEVPNGTLLSASPKSKWIEVVGDSISCGFGNEAPNKETKFTPETENAYQSYASIAARKIDADVQILAWSGRKMWPDNTMPEIYNRVLPTLPEPIFDFRGPAPAAVVINLATNDFGKENPDEVAWTAAYAVFIQRIWGHYPNARVYVAIGSMMTDNWPPNHKALSTLRKYLSGMVDRMKDPRLKWVEFPVQDEKNGIGADWHPSIRTHEIMGTQLANLLRRDLAGS